ncbi:MAG: ABC transporter ATP-binding protein [Candidatus Hodarchaeales archaeon]
MARVNMDDVIKKFGENIVLTNINIDIEDKEMVVFVGPSGCGKTTAMRCVAGLEEVSSGKVFIGDRLVNNVPPKDRDIAMVFQNYALYPHMKVFDNIAFGLRARKIPVDSKDPNSKLRKMTNEEIEEKVHEAARILQIENLLRRKPSELSGGQMQRVAMGRAIVREPQVFLMDEPLSNLDAKLRTHMRTELKRLQIELGVTTIYVTHDQAEAMTLGDRIAVMNDGVFQQIGTPEVVYNKPVNKFVAGFIGSPPMNFLPGKLELREKPIFSTESINFEIPENLANMVKEKAKSLDNLVLGIRPEDIEDNEFTLKKIEGATITAEVKVRENHGSDIFLSTTIGNTILQARVNTGTSAQVGKTIDLLLDFEKTHIFDGETEINLTV